MANFEGPLPPEDAAARIVRVALGENSSPGFVNEDGTVHPW